MNCCMYAYNTKIVIINCTMYIEKRNIKIELDQRFNLYMPKLNTIAYIVQNYKIIICKP